MIETKQSAERVAQKLDLLIDVPRPLRIHWTGCPNSCGQVQAADIGLMGGPAKKLDPATGKAKAVVSAAPSHLLRPPRLCCRWKRLP